MAEENEDKPKLTKTEAEESFLKRLEDKTNELRATEERIRNLVERNEELASRNLLGGRTDAGVQPVLAKAETPQEYAKRMSSGNWKAEELKKEL